MNYRIEYYDEHTGEWEVHMEHEDFFEMEKQFNKLKESKDETQYRFLEIRIIGEC